RTTAPTAGRPPGGPWPVPPGSVSPRRPVSPCPWGSPAAGAARCRAAARGNASRPPRARGRARDCIGRSPAHRQPLQLEDRVGIGGERLGHLVEFVHVLAPELDLTGVEVDGL